MGWQCISTKMGWLCFSTKMGWLCVSTKMGWLCISTKMGYTAVHVISKDTCSHCGILNKKKNNHFGENALNLFAQCCADIIIKVHRKICCSYNRSSGFQLHIV